jgi:dynein heavy chain
LLAPNNSDFSLFTSQLSFRKVVWQCTSIHESVKRATRDYYEEQRRYNYITPNKFILLIQTFRAVVSRKRELYRSKLQRLSSGLQSIDSANLQVSNMLLHLEELRPELENSQQETEKLLTKLTADK